MTELLTERQEGEIHKALKHERKQDERNKCRSGQVEMSQWLQE